MKDLHNNIEAQAYPLPAVSIDVVIFTIIDKKLAVLTIKRAIGPFKGEWTLVGGYVDINKDNDLMATAKRKLFEKTGVNAPYLVQCQSVGNATRDPRGWSVTVVYYALMPGNAVKLNIGLKALDIVWTFVDNIHANNHLAFDHYEILKIALAQLRQKILTSTIPVHFMPEEFTLRDLQEIYELILNKHIDAKSFRRRILSADILEPTDKKRFHNYRPATLYTRKKNTLDYEFIRHIESVASG